ncbi:MAG TPA: hypothetical protein VFS20_28870 [Longimicrobium sp.]|nr:hypothetical protein [Longimicrobium sp.]
MSVPNLDAVRGSVLTRMERAERLTRMAIYAAGAVELALFAVAIYLVDWDNRLERLLFIFSVLSYTIIALGLLALGGHVTRSVGRVLAAMDPGGAR